MAGLLFYNILGKAMGTLVTMNGGFKGVPVMGEKNQEKIIDIKLGKLWEFAH